MKFDKEKLEAWQAPRFPHDRGHSKVSLKESLLLSCMEWHPDNPNRGKGRSEPMCERDVCEGCPRETNDFDDCLSYEDPDDMYKIFKRKWEDLSL